MTTPDLRRVVVIGAGMAGLAAADVLRPSGADVVVLDREAWVGGRILTVEVEQHPVDLGAQFVASFYPEALDLVRSLGLGARLVERPQEASVVVGGEAHRVDSIRSIAGSSMLSVGTRLRLPLLMVPVLAASRHLDPDDLQRAAPLDDERGDEWVRKWAGDELASNLVEPLIRGLMYWDLATTSRALVQLLLRVALQSREVHRIDGGMSALPRALADGLDVRLGTRATGLHPRDDGGWRVELESASTIDADAVVCATTADVAAELCPDATVAEVLRSVSYSRTAGVVVRVPASITTPTSTLLFTRPAADVVAAVNPTGAVSPDGSTLVRIFLSDAGARRLHDCDDSAVAAEALAAVADAGADSAWATEATPVHVHRWRQALPRFDVGSLRRPPAGDPAALDVGSLVFAGDYIGGPFVEGALRSGRAAAQRLLDRR